MLAQKADGSEPELLEGVKQLLPVVRSSQEILQVSLPPPPPSFCVLPQKTLLHLRLVVCAECLLPDCL
jgi:hypothetical protein